MYADRNSGYASQSADDVCTIQGIKVFPPCNFSFTFKCRLSHRPNLITSSVVIWRISNTNVLRVELLPTTFVAIFAAHCPINMRHRGLGSWVSFNQMQMIYWPCVIVCVFFWLVGLTELSYTDDHLVVPYVTM